MKNVFLNFKAFMLSRKSQLPYDIGKILLRKALQISCAESCTGGLISSRLTDVAGSSAYIKANFVTYSNEAKHKILNVKSGITGLAQISGRRDLPWEQRRKLDVYYVQNWSFALDIQILFKTVWQVFTSKGAV